MIGARHPVLGRLRRLSRQRSVRTAENAFVIDGPTLLAEALAAAVAIDEVVAEPDAAEALLARAEEAGAVVHRAPAGTLARVTATVTPQSTAAIARPGDRSLEGALDGLERPQLVLVLVAVNDPGNAGTLMRSAEAAGAEAVIFCDDSVDPYNPKAVRGSAGSVFRLRVVRSAEAPAALKALHERGIQTIGTVAHGGTPYDALDLTVPSAIVVGSEAHGLAEAVLSRLDERATIPMRAPVESLNVGMAGTLVCFEALRQRRRVGSQGHPRNPLDGAASPEGESVAERSESHMRVGR